MSPHKFKLVYKLKSFQLRDLISREDGSSTNKCLCWVVSERIAFMIFRTIV